MTTLTGGKRQNDTYLTASEAAHELRIGLSTLNKMRIYGNGPAFVKVGSRVLYRQADLHEWMESRLRRSTSSAPREGRE